MADDTAVPAGSAPAQPAVEPAAPVVPAVEPAGSAPAANASDVPPVVPGSEPAKPLGDKGVQELIDQRRRRQDAEREAAYWRGVAEGGGARQAPPQQQRQAPVEEPRLEQFEKYDDFVVAKAEFKIMQRMQQNQAAQGRQAVAQNFGQRVRKAAEKNPDILSVLDDRTIPISAPMADAIQESDLGPEIAYHLKQNPLEAERIAYLSPVAAIREIGKIEARLSAPASQTTQRISQAPEPIKALGGGGHVAEANLETMSVEDFMKKRNAETAKKR